MSEGCMFCNLYIGTVFVVLFCYLANKFYFSGSRCKSKARLDGKVVIITGSNTGIGYETALELAKRGAKVVMACRDMKKAEEACEKIKLEANTKEVFIEKLDLASRDSIFEFSNNFKAKFGRLDILINNAGLGFIPKMKTKDGFEMMFGTMHLGHFYLTGLLINFLKANGSARIVNVSSLAHWSYKMDWDDLQGEKSFGSFKQYCRSKLANCLFTYELARRFSEYGITAVSLHPGYVRTDIFRELQNRPWKELIYTILTPVLSVVSKNCRQGAQTTIHCAVDEDVPKHNGEYFDNCKVARCSPMAKDPGSAKKLWEISEKLTGFNY